MSSNDYLEGQVPDSTEEVGVDMEYWKIDIIKW